MEVNVDSSSLSVGRLERHWLPLLICWFALITDGYEVFIYGATLPSIIGTRSWGVTTASAGIVGSISLFGLLTGAIACGTLTDVLGRRKIFQFSIGIYSVAALVCALAPNFTIFATARLVAGLGLGGLMPTVVAIVSELAPLRYRHRIVSLVLTGPFVGAVVAAIVALAVLPHGGFRPVYALGVVPLVTTLPMAYIWLPESVAFLRYRDRGKEADVIAAKYDIESPEEDPIVTRSGAPKSPITVLFIAKYRWATVGFWLTMVLVQLISYATSTWLPKFMLQAGFPFASSLDFLLYYSVSAIVGTLTAARIAERIGTTATIVIGFFLCAVGFFLLIADTRVAATCAVVVAGFGFGTVLNLMLDHVTAYYPSVARATGVGWANGVGRFGAIAGPSYGAWIISIAGGGVVATAVSMALPAALGGLVMASLPRRRSTQGLLRAVPVIARREFRSQRDAP